MSTRPREPLQSIADAVLTPTSAPGVQARTGRFEQVIDGLNALITRQRDAQAQVLRFPPVMSRALLERQGYHKNFPHLLGCVCALGGSEPEIRALVSGESGAAWTQALAATDLVLSPAACYPLYPLVAARGPIAVRGEQFDVASYCFRRESTHEPGRLQAFRMREFVAMGTPEQTDAFRLDWVARAEMLADELALPHGRAAASDPFFGRVGKMLAASQVEQALKYELLIPLGTQEAGMACMSFNYHQDYFGATLGLRTEAGVIAHTSCVAFGIDRLGLALFATHGLDLAAWPPGVRGALSLA